MSKPATRNEMRLRHRKPITRHDERKREERHLRKVRRLKEGVM